MANILVVEDEKIVATDIASTLEGLGYSVPGVVSSGEEAVRRVGELHPDLVLMDIVLGGQMDGVQAARLMRQRFSIPVVFLTAFADGDSLNRARASEPFGYIVKPFNEKELRSTIEIALYKHQVEQQLRQRERWFSTTLRCVGNAVIATDPGGKITFLNPVAESLVGCSAERALGRPIAEIFRLIDLQTGRIADNPVQQVLHGHPGIPPTDAALIDEQGREIPIDSRTAPIIDDKDHLLGAVVVFRDITERKRDERRMVLADRLAAVGAMATGVAHEVNNPLTYLIGNLGFGIEELKSIRTELERTSASSLQTQPNLLNRLDSALEALSESRDGAQRVQRVMQDLGTFSRAGDEVSTRVNLHELLEAALKMTTNQIGARVRVSRLFHDVPSVDANPSNLGQVFVNLLVNAAQAIRNAGTEGEIRVATDTDPQGRAVVEISDTGPGISRDALKRIFQPFYGGEPGGRAPGMGLAICHEIVTRMGGEITVDSQPGKGSAFRVTLPAAASEQGNAKLRSRPAPLVRRGRILVVDDEPIVGGSIRRTLAKEHDVVVVSSGKEALALIQAGEAFDLILSDVMMPEMSGIDLYQELLKLRPGSARRMIFLTGGAFTQGARKFLDSVPNSRLEKPFDPDRLRRFVREQLTDEKMSGN
jgi:PAS domain S-box-containing protein